MFSWKNIKDTYTEKVTNSNSVGDKTLGILEVVGKSIVSSATVVAKELPSFANKMASTANEHAKENANRLLGDSNSSQEDREKAQAYLAKYSENKDLINEHKHKIKDSSTGNYDQENIRLREVENYSSRIEKLESNRNKYYKDLKNFEEKKQKVISRIDSISDDEQKTKEENHLKRLNELQNQYELKIAAIELEIEKYSKRLEGY